MKGGILPEGLHVWGQETERSEPDPRLGSAGSRPGVPGPQLGRVPQAAIPRTLWNEGAICDSHWRLFTCQFAWKVNSPFFARDFQEPFLQVLGAPPRQEPFSHPAILPPRGYDSLRPLEHQPKALTGLPE